MLKPISRNSSVAPIFKLVVSVAPGTNRTLVHLAPSPSTNSNRAGMLVTNVPMKNQPKIRPVR